MKLRAMHAVPRVGGSGLWRLLRTVRPQVCAVVGGGVMRIARRSLRHPRFLIALFSIAVCCSAPNAPADEYPSRSITVIVPFATGGGSDVQARIIAKALSERLGKPVVVDNRPGAGGRLGTALAARAKPDGYTLVFGSITTFVVEPTIQKDPGYSTLRDFEGVTVATSSATVLVCGQPFPARTFGELIAMAKQRPGELTYASVGAGSTSHLLTEAFKASASVDLTHVPYKGEGPALIDVMSGRVSVMFPALPAALNGIQSGQLRALAIRGASRVPSLPDVPTLKELGVSSSEIQAWWGFALPAKTSREIVQRLSRELNGVLRSAPVQEALAKQGVSIVASGTGEFAYQVLRESQAIAALAKRIGFDPEK